MPTHQPALVTCLNVVLCSPTASALSRGATLTKCVSHRPTRRTVVAGEIAIMSGSWVGHVRVHVHRARMERPGAGIADLVSKAQAVCS